MPIIESFRQLFSKSKGEKSPEENEELKGDVLKAAIAEATKNAGMSPELVEKFLNFEEPESPVDITKAASILLLLHFITLTAVNMGVGASLDPSLQLPLVVHEFFQSIHNASVNAAASMSFRSHAPFLLLEIGAYLGGSKISETIKNFKKDTKTALKIRSVLEGKRDTGEINFKMQEGHSAVFSGNGDSYATWLQEELGRDDVMTYTTNPEKDETLTKQSYELSSTKDSLDAAMERGDFINAGEIILLPVTEEDQFLPDRYEENGGFDMKMSDMKIMLTKMDDFITKKELNLANENIGYDSMLAMLSAQEAIKRKQKQKKKVIIVSSLKQTGILKVGREKIPSEGTLEQFVESENEKRKHLDIEIVDPTDLVFKALVPLLSGKQPEFIAEGQSADRYTDRFYAEFDERTTRDEKATDDRVVLTPSSKDSVRVFYNVSDIDTAANALLNDIAIVSTEKHKQTLISDGMNPERIIVISKLVKDRIEELVHPK